MRRAAPQQVYGELIVVLRPRPQMVDIRLAESRHVKVRLCGEALTQTDIEVPIGGINRYMAVSITVSRQVLSHGIALLGRLSFFQHGKAKQTLLAHLRLKQDACLRDIGRELLKRHRVVASMRVRMVAD